MSESMLSTTRQPPILITGASGFFGEHLTRYLLSQEYRVAGTYLSAPPEIEAAEVLPFDVTDELAWNRLLRDMKPQAIVHCAAKTRAGWVKQNPQDARRVNVEGTQTLARAVAERAPDTRVVYVSTDMVFDGEDAPYGETDPAKPTLLYGSQKYEAEESILKLPYGQVMRSALIYGNPTSRAGSFLSWIVDCLMSKDEMATLFEDEWRTPIYAKDAARAVETLLTNDVSEETKLVHAGGAERLNRYRMGERVCEVFDLPRTNLVRSLRPKGQGVEARPRDLSLRCERLLHLGWNPISFRDGLIECRNSWNAYKPRPFG